MKFYDTGQRPPKNGKYYIVKCPDYSESGYHIARWDGFKKQWESDSGDPSINNFVTEYANLPGEHFQQE